MDAATPLETPAAGSRLRILQEETREQLRAREERGAKESPQPATPQRAAAQSSDARLHVEAFEVHGVSRFTAEEIAAVLKPWTGRDLDTAGLHDAADALNRFYRRAGYFAARVFVPPQATGGAIRLEVFEGFLEADGIELKNGGRLVDPAVVGAILERNIPTDRPMHRADFERGLLLAEDLPGVHVKGTLYPGSAVGTARLRAVLTDEPRFAGNLDFDNHGNEFTGRERLGSTLYFNSPGGVGDQVVARLVTSGRESSYGYLTYLRPVSPSGLRLGASVDAFRYETSAYSDLGHARGHAVDMRLYATYPIVRSRHGNLHARGEVFVLGMRDRNEVGIDSARRVTAATVTFGGDEDQDWLSPGVTTFEVSATAGRMDIRGDDVFRFIDAASARVDGRFARANVSAMRLQPLGGAWSLFGRVGAQVGSRNLDGSQKFYVGGANSVSGYPVGEAGGDRGADAHLEVRREFAAPWGGLAQGGVFWQQGWIRQHKAPWEGWQGLVNPGQPNALTLKTVGFSLTQNWGAEWVLRGNAGWQVDDNPLRDPRNGRATDGRTARLRAWVQVIRYF